MSNTFTQRITQADPIEHLDFTPRCDMRIVIWVVVGWLPVRKCQETAVWMTKLPCCGMWAFCCAGHRRTSLDKMCPRCGESYADSGSTWAWVRI